jgi:hypothetical protein
MAGNVVLGEANPCCAPDASPGQSKYQGIRISLVVIVESAEKYNLIRNAPALVVPWFLA